MVIPHGLRAKFSCLLVTITVSVCFFLFTGREGLLRQNLIRHVTIHLLLSYHVMHNVMQVTDKHQVSPLNGKFTTSFQEISVTQSG